MAKSKSTKVYATLIDWDEIGGDAQTTFLHANGREIRLTRDNDQKLVDEIRKINGDEKDDGEWGWTLVGIAHLPKTTVIEWRSERGHHAVTTICWMPELIPVVYGSSSSATAG